MGISNMLSNPLSVLYTLPAIIIGLTVHEWAHAYAAYKLGDPTARNMGRMTLNPLRHIDPFGFLMLLLVGFGWAKPVPVNPRNFKRFRRDDIIVSMAGVTMNLITAFVFTLLLYAGMFYLNLLDNQAFISIFSSIVSINLSLMVFNLIPIYPLDGSHVLESLLMRRIPRFFLFVHQYGTFILIAVLLLMSRTGLLSRIVQMLFSLLSTAALFLLGLG